MERKLRKMDRELNEGTFEFESQQIARLTYLLLSRGICTSRDIDYIIGREKESSWMEYNKQWKERRELEKQAEKEDIVESTIDWLNVKSK